MEKQIKIISFMVSHWAFDKDSLKKLCECSNNATLIETHAVMLQEIEKFRTAFASYKKAAKMYLLKDAIELPEQDDVSAATKSLIDATQAFAKALADKELVLSLATGECRKPFVAYASDVLSSGERTMNDKAKNLQFVTERSWVSKPVLHSLIQTKSDLEDAVFNMELIMTQLNDVVDMPAMERLSSCAAESCKEGKDLLAFYRKIRDSFEDIPKGIAAIKAQIPADDATDEKIKSDVIKLVGKSCKMYAEMFRSFVGYFLLTHDGKLLNCLLDKCANPLVDTAVKALSGSQSGEIKV